MQSIEDVFEAKRKVGAVFVDLTVTLSGTAASCPVAAMLDSVTVYEPSAFTR